MKCFGSVLYHSKQLKIVIVQKLAPSTDKTNAIKRQTFSSHVPGLHVHGITITIS